MERVTNSNNVNYPQEIFQTNGVTGKLSSYIVGNIIKITPIALGIIASSNLPLVEAGGRRDCMVECLGPNPEGEAPNITLCNFLCLCLREIKVCFV